jgi:hypothetical protein
VLATGSDFDRVARLRSEGDPYVSAWYETAVGFGADLVLMSSPVTYHLPDGVRLLSISRKVLQRIRQLGLAYRVSGDEKFAARAWAELRTVAGFDTWHPEHFLDVAEMAAAVATGYDWFYDYWDESQRETLRRALVEKAIDLGIEAHEGSADFPDWWTDTRHNWNSVCNGGLAVAALALLGEPGVERATLQRLLAYARESLRKPVRNFGADGGWPEGPSYWEYNTRYQVYYLTTLVSTLGGGGVAGVDAGIDATVPDAPGFRAAGSYPPQMTGPTGQFNYGDSSTGRNPQPSLLWLARQFDRPDWAAFELETTGTENGEVAHLLWYDPAIAGDRANLPRAKAFRGVDVATARSAWADDAAGFVGFKGGNNADNHTDLDLGSFVYDAEGTRWAVDLGREDYNVPGYWDAGPEGQRWTYYRKRAEGHNTLVVAPDGDPDQRVRGQADVERFEAGERGVYGVVDLGPAYQNVQAARRGFGFDRATKGLLVQDELALAEPAPVWWFMHTPASIRADGTTATLSAPEGEATLRARLLAPEGATFRTRPAGPLPSSPDPPEQMANEAVRKLSVGLEGIEAATVAVHLAPVVEGVAPAAPPVAPLADWSVRHVAGDGASDGGV